MYANTVDLQRMALENQLRQQQEEEEKDGEATTPTTPSSLQSTQVRGAGNTGTIGEGRVGSTLGGEETVPSCLFQALILWVTFPFSLCMYVCVSLTLTRSLVHFVSLYLKCVCVWLLQGFLPLSPTASTPLKSLSFSVQSFSSRC